MVPNLIDERRVRPEGETLSVFRPATAEGINEIPLCDGCEETVAAGVGGKL